MIAHPRREVSSRGERRGTKTNDVAAAAAEEEEEAALYRQNDGSGRKREMPTTTTKPKSKPPKPSWSHTCVSGGTRLFAVGGGGKKLHGVRLRLHRLHEEKIILEARNA